MLQEAIGMFEAVFTNLDTISLAIAVGVTVLAGLIMRGYGSVLYVTVGALIVYAGAQFARGILLDNADPQAQLNTWWSNLQTMTFADFLVYFVAFFIVVTVVFILKSIFLRR